MKTKLFLSIILALSPALTALGQIPQGINYQAIARGSDGKELQNTPLQVKLSILSDTTGFYASGSGTYIWEEQQSTTTNKFGLFTLTFGNPLASKIQGSATSFSAIDWKAQPLFMGIKINPNGTGWKILGSAKLWSVPYSMVSGDLAGPVRKLSVTGTTSVMDEALFEVKNKNGQTVFAVYNEGVRIYVEDGIEKGTKGGFAIGSFGTAKAASQPLFVVDPDSIRAYIYDDPLVKRSKGGFAIGGFNNSKAITNDYLLVSPDSIRAYITTEPAKGTKGGFAIGGFDRAKAIDGEEYLRVTRDSTRIYIKEAAKGTKGGFAIGSFNPAKGPAVSPFTSLTPDNYFIGHQSGKKMTTGLYNSFVGYETGPNNTSGSYNAFFGYQAGYQGTTGSSNLFLGYQSGFSNTAGGFNSFMGYKSGYLNTTGDKNTFMGSFAGVSNTTGSNNTFSGFNSGFSNADGQANNFYGTGSGYSNLSGNNNTFIGPESGYKNIAGSFNTFLGYRTGYNNNASNNVFIGNECGFSNTSGDLNVFIGYSAGRANTSGDKNVFIGYLSGMQGTSTYSNVCIGHQSGMGLTSAYNNVFVGSNTGLKTTWGESNVFIGSAAGEANITGGYNVHIGTGAGQKANAGDNIFIGYAAGYGTTTGGSNVYIGMQAGYQNVTGQNNIFIGKFAGYYETSSDKLYIDNSLTTSPLIYGDFNLNNLMINGNLSVNSTYFRLTDNPGTGATPVSYAYQGAPASTAKANAFSVYDAFWVTGPSFLDKYVDINVSGAPALYVAGDEALWYDGTAFSWGFGGVYNVFADKMSVGTTASPGAYTLYVVGNALSTGVWATSDSRWKKDLEVINNTMPAILQLQGYKYSWRGEEYPDMKFDKDRQIGLIAQDVEKICPELVKMDANGYKAVSYEKLSVILLEGMKEQQKMIEQQKTEIESLREEISEIRQLLQVTGSR